MFKYNLIVLFIAVTFLFSACQLFKPTLNSNSNKYYEAFYIGNNQSQYFIKPISFDNEENEEMELDMLIKDKTKTNDSTALNLSLITPIIIKELDSLKVRFDNNVVKIVQVQNIFTEKKKDNYKSRFTFKMINQDVYMLFSENKWQFELHSKNKVSIFKLENSSPKSFKDINDNLILIIK